MSDIIYNLSEKRPTKNGSLGEGFPHEEQLQSRDYLRIPSLIDARGRRTRL